MMENYITYDPSGTFHEDSNSLTTIPYDFQSGKDWNAEFQELMEQHFENPHDEMQRTLKLRDLADLFAERSKAIGKTIIDELYLPYDDKTIKPVTGHVGGIAGGEKYVQDGIFFKFALDNKGIYGGDEYALKSGSHEFLGFLELLNCRVRGLHFPFIVIIDYLGYRLIALSVLPIGPSTLIYGSSDGGKTIHDDDAQFTASIKTISKILNLTGHQVWNNSKASKYTLYTPIDCEGHKGTDGRFYIIDPARLFPPSYHGTGRKGSKLYRLMRPELVKMSPNPLCPDAFTSFKVENIDIYEQHIKETTQLLLNNVLPSLANTLIQEYSKKSIETRNTLEISMITTKMHLKGINIRYLGLLLKHIPTEMISLRKLLFTIIVGRTSKNMIRNHMRSLKTSNEKIHSQLVIGYLNLMFGSGEKSDEFWDQHLISYINKTFLDFLDTNLSIDIRSHIYPALLYFYLLEKLGIETKRSPFLKLQDHGVLKAKLDIHDIHSIHPKVKYTNRLSFEEATAMSQLAIQKTAKSSDKYFQMAEIKYRAALEIKPNDTRTLHNWGISLMLQAKSKSEAESEVLYNLSESKWVQAISLNSNDFRAWMYWGDMLMNRTYHTMAPLKRLEYTKAAIEKYERAALIQPKSHIILRNYAISLLTLAEYTHDTKPLYEDAVIKLKLALSLKPRSFKIQHHLAISLAKHARSIYQSDQHDIKQMEDTFLESYQYFEACLKEKPHSCDILFNYGNTCLRHAKLLEKINQEKCHHYCTLASEKFICALTYKLSYFGAIYNWANALFLQIRLNRYENETLFSLQCFLEVYRKVILKYPHQVSFEPITMFFKLEQEKIIQKVFAILISIGNTSKDDKMRSQVLDEIKKVAHIPIFAEMISKRSFMNSLQLHNEVTAIIQTIGSGYHNVDDDKMDMNAFKISETFEEDDGIHKVHLATLQSSKKAMILIEIDRDALIDHLDPKNPFNKSLQSLLKLLSLTRPFMPIVTNVFQTEEDSFCFSLSLTHEYTYVSALFQNDTFQNPQDRLDALVFYASELIIALSSLHELDLIYKDLYSNTICIDQDGHISLHKIPYILRKQSLDEDDVEYGKGNDWKFLAVVLYQWITCDTETYQWDFDFIREYIITQENHQIDKKLIDFLGILLSIDENHIDPIHAFKNHALFNNINWDKMKSKEGCVPYKPQRGLTLTQVPTYISHANQNKFRGFSFIDP